MFDLITGNVTHAPRPRATPVIVSIAVHATVVGAVLVGTLAFVTAPVPELPMMMAFVAPPPPPPPPPPAPLARPPEKRETPTPVPTSGDVAPITPPSEIEAEPAVEDDEEVGGIEGGVPGGITGGVVGGLIAEIPPPPAPPPPLQTPRAPVRVGGQIKEPTLIHRVDPEYPMLARVSQIEGVVILEAIVDEGGRIESLKVLRSAPVFEQVALAAVRQWRYSPVILNGRPEKFILTVVVSFHLEK